MKDDYIVIRGARENNLKGVTIDIPKGKIVVFTGVSGSGKSSLVFDTIAAESKIQLEEMLSPYLRNRMPRQEHPRVDFIDHLSAAVAVDQRPFTGNIRSTVATMTDAAPLLRLLFSRCASPLLGTGSSYSCNDPQGMCPVCSGLGRVVKFDLDKALDKQKSLNEGAILFPGHGIGTYQWQLYAKSGLYDPDKPLNKFTKEEWHDFLHGSGVTVNIENTSGKVWDDYKLTYEGILDRITRLYLKKDFNTLNNAGQKNVRKYTSETICESCKGKKYKKEVLESRLEGFNIFEAGEMEIQQIKAWIGGLTNPIATVISKKIIEIFDRIIDMGLSYLNLNRSTVSLSGGEVQRLKLVRHLGSSLTGLTYIFDEPSKSLHPKDIASLNNLFGKLKNRNNTVLVVEHNRDIISTADRIIDMGPGAGKLGGEIIFEGTLRDFTKANTITAQYFNKSGVFKPTNRLTSSFKSISIDHANLHNLKDVSVRIPLKALTVICGVSGSGKTSLAVGELTGRYPQAVHISQDPIGSTSRSTPATYAGVMDNIRYLFGRANNVGPGIFSFNSEGACVFCKGKGELKTEMAFMDPVITRCEMCDGLRYNEKTLGYRYRNFNIVEIMNMTVDEAIDFFRPLNPPGREDAHLWEIQKKLKTFADTGMGYITLGQSTNALSGGESQRLKLSAHINENVGIYVMDEPTIGLHKKDVENLIALFNKMIDNGNTLIIVEHDTDIIKQADYIIEMGPGGGDRGGAVLYEGKPGGILTCGESVTAPYLM
jgi:excinuclease UvrABC ATPase subunit